MGYRPRHRAVSGVERWSRRILIGLVILLLLTIFVYPLVETRLIETEEKELTSADLPQDADGLRIVYLSDIHQGPFYGKGAVESLVARVNALRPDLLLLGGDYANDTAGAVEFFRNAPAFHAKYGIYGVLGDKDREETNASVEQLRAAMMAAGVNPLVNETSVLRIGNSQIYIAGLDDSTWGTPDAAKLAAQLSGGDYVILMAHSPNALTNALGAGDRNGKKNWFDLGLFGHTHGGQLAIGGTLLVGSEVSAKYRGGWFQENKIDMLVSRGIGTVGIPARFLRRPQIHVIRVKR